jgi:hypothetical protein
MWRRGWVLLGRAAVFELLPCACERHALLGRERVHLGAGVRDEVQRRARVDRRSDWPMRSVPCWHGVADRDWSLPAVPRGLFFAAGGPGHLFALPGGLLLGCNGGCVVLFVPSGVHEPGSRHCGLQLFGWLRRRGGKFLWHYFSAQQRVVPCFRHVPREVCLQQRLIGVHGCVRVLLGSEGATRNVQLGSCDRLR